MDKDELINILLTIKTGLSLIRLEMNQRESYTGLVLKNQEVINNSIKEKIKLKIIEENRFLIFQDELEQIIANFNDLTQFEKAVYEKLLCFRLKKIIKFLAENSPKNSEYILDFNEGLYNWIYDDYHYRFPELCHSSRTSGKKWGELKDENYSLKCQFDKYTKIFKKFEEISKSVKYRLIMDEINMYIKKSFKMDVYNFIKDVTDEKGVSIASLNIINFEKMKRMSNEKIKNIYKELLQKYEKIISRYDWKNIDTIMYYLETNRADNLKEALILYDMQERHNVLLNTLEYSRESINIHLNHLEYSLSNSLNLFAQSVNMKLKKLNESITHSNSEMIKNINNNSELSRVTQNMNTQSIIKFQDMQTALLNSINVSSNKLAIDTEKIMREFNIN